MKTFEQYPKLIELCKAIKTFEGGKLSRHNPGNERVSQYKPNGVIGQDNGFWIFKDDTTGWNFLLQKIYNICTGQSATYNYEAKRQFKLKDSSELTIFQYISIQSPTTDDNEPLHYAITICAWSGLKTTDQMKSLLTDTPVVPNVPITQPNQPKVIPNIPQVMDNRKWWEKVADAILLFFSKMPWQ